MGYEVVVRSLRYGVLFHRLHYLLAILIEIAELVILWNWRRFCKSHYLVLLRMSLTALPAVISL
jgi:hypothetical protein